MPKGSNPGDAGSGALVIIPTYNEIGNLRTILGRIKAAVPAADILVVDDSSPDGTGQLADLVASEDTSIFVLHRPARGGIGQAYLAGFEQAQAGGYEFAVEIDADGSHDPRSLPRMIEKARDGAALVIGSRWVSGGRVRDWPWSRQAISRAGNAYSRIVLRSHIKDITAGFRVFRVDALRTIDLHTVASQGYCFQVEMAWRLERSGHAVAEVPITFVERQVGISKMHSGIVIEALARVTVWGIAAGLRRTAISTPAR